jgi:N-acyl homoserine lactone hydrolase
VSDIAIRRVDFGYFVRPSEETATGKARVEPCLGYVVEHPGGVLLFDTGMGSHPEVDARYRPRRHDLTAALAAAGTDVGHITQVANCHLHFDHCGGNPQLVGRPVFVQAGELAEARNTDDYTLPELLDGSRFEELAGESEVLPGVFLMPTPGHTSGHQSLIVRRADGAVIVAGQSHDTASEYAADHLSWRAHHDGHDQPLPEGPVWMKRLQDFDPRVVYFAHDHSIWIP